MDSIPLAIIAATVWIYWIAAIRKVIRARRRGRPAGLVPRQGLERILWVFWVPVILGWLVLPILAVVIGRPPFVPPGGLASHQADPPRLEGAIRWAAAAVAVICLLVTVSCWRRMGKSWRMGVIPGETTALVTGGLYGRMRHPIYAFSILLMASTALALPTAPMLAIAAAHAFLMLLKARNEERFLLEAHGEAYADYLRRTGGFFPRLRPGRP